MAAETIVQKIRPVDLFANTFPHTIPALRCAKKSWKQLDCIFFAVTHLGIVSVPESTNYYCESIWTEVAAKEFDTEEYIDDISKLLDDVSWTLKIVLLEAIRLFLLSCTMKDNAPMNPDVRVTKHEKLVKKPKCNIMGCVCMLVGNSTHDINTTPESEFAALWLTRSKMRAPRRTNRRNKRMHKPKTQSF